MNDNTWKEILAFGVGLALIILALSVGARILFWGF